MSGAATSPRRALSCARSSAAAPGLKRDSPIAFSTACFNPVRASLRRGPGSALPFLSPQVCSDRHSTRPLPYVPTSRLQPMPEPALPAACLTYHIPWGILFFGRTHERTRNAAQRNACGRGPYLNPPTRRSRCWCCVLLLLLLLLLLPWTRLVLHPRASFAHANLPRCSRRRQSGPVRSSRFLYNKRPPELILQFPPSVRKPMCAQ